MLCQEIFAHSLQQHQQIALLSGDVLTDSSDALAVPCDKNLLLYTSLAGQAEALAGGSLRPLIRQVLQQIPDGVCPVGNAIALPVSECELSRRGFRHLILAVTPSYGDADPMQTLGKLTQSILEAAVQVGAVRVSIPLLRVGIDDLLSARSMLWACGCFMQNHPETVLQARFTALMPHDKTLHQAMQFCLAGESPEATVSTGPRTAQPAPAASAPAVQQVQWEWCSDNSQSQPGQQYRPYDSQASAQIEQAFQRRSDIKPGNPVEKITITGRDYHVFFDPLAGLHFQQSIRLGTKRHIRRTTPNTTPAPAPAPSTCATAIPATPAQPATDGPPPQLPPPPPLTPGVHALAVPLVSVAKVSGEIERVSQLAGICVYQDTEGNLILHGTDIESLRQMRDYMLAPSFPEQWTPFAATTGYFEVATDSEEFAAVKQLFDASRAGTLEKVERVQHKAAWARYVKTRSLIAAKNGLLGVNEKLLFHGTRSPEAIAMLEGAFSVTYSNGGMWGKAVYFAAKASYSRTYAHLTADGKKQMFLASVSVGRSVKLAPDSSLRLPPPLPEDPALRYDTVQGETGGSDVYMVYENDRACPVYRLTFT